MSIKEKIQQYFDESMQIKSFTHTEKEKDIENYLYKAIAQMDYFKENPDKFGKMEIPNDILKRENVWALSYKGAKDTVIIFHHHDIVNLDAYGNLKDIALDSEKLKEEYLKTSSDEDLLADIKSDQWILGRGSCDMKAALAIQMAVLEEYTKIENKKVNLLFLSVPDEESYSKGMRAAVNHLNELKEKFDLNYILAIDSEPFESATEKEKTIHIGTVGKWMPMIVTQGIVSHIKEPLKGINAIPLLSSIVTNIDLNPEFSDQVGNSISPLPSWSYMRDQKETYDVTTAKLAAGYFSILGLEKTPKENMQVIEKIAKVAVKSYYTKFIKLQGKYQVNFPINEPKVMSYADLKEKCEEKENYNKLKEEITKITKENFQNGMTYQDIAMENIKKTLDFYDSKDPLVIIAAVPPYYPAMNSKNIQSELSIDKLTAMYETFLKGDAKLVTDQYFMGICDLSYCALENDTETYQEVLDTMAVPKEQYDIDFKTIKNLNIPGVNIGPWGKALHKATERVYKKDMFETIPNFLLTMLENIDKLKK